MGTTFFLLLIATCLGGALLFLRKVNANSYLVGVKDDAVDFEALKFQKVRQKKETENPRVEAYVDWYMTKMDSARSEGEQRKNLLGTGFVINDSANGNSEQKSRALH